LSGISDFFINFAQDIILVMRIRVLTRHIMLTVVAISLAAMAAVAPAAAQTQQQQNNAAKTEAGKEKATDKQGTAVMKDTANKTGKTDSTLKAKAVRDASLDKNVLVFAGAWDDYPYCYVNDHREPSGLAVEIIRAICEKADIPCRIVLKDMHESSRMVAEGIVDIGVGCRQTFGDSVYYSPTVVFTTRPIIAYAKGKPHIQHFTDIQSTPVIVERNSFMAIELKARGWYRDSLATDDAKRSLLNISATEEGQLITNQDAAFWLIRKFGLKNIATEEVNMPLEERRFASKDKAVVQKIENVYNVMKASGEMDRLVNNWYHDTQKEHLPFNMWIVVGILAAIIAAMIASVIRHNKKEKEVEDQLANQTRRLQIIQNASNTTVWTYDLITKDFTLYDKDMNPVENETWARYVGNMTRHGYRELVKAIDKIKSGESDEETISTAITHRQNGQNTTDHDEETEVNIRVAVLNEKDGQPTVLVGTQYDKAKELIKLQNHELVMRYYQVVFENGFVDLCLFTPDGEMLRYNQHFRQTFDIKDISKAKKHISETDFYYFFDKKRPNLLPAVTAAKGRYYRSSFIPIYNDKGELVYVCGRGVDITASVETYKQNKNDAQTLTKALEEKEKLAEQAKYAINSGRTYLYSYDPKERVFTSYNGIDEPGMTYTEIQCLQSTHEESQDMITNIFQRMDNREDITSTQTVRTKLISKEGGNIYLSFTIGPQKDEKGNIIAYLGTYNGATKMMTTQKKLEEEHERALEAEHIKGAFLKNMSYEIRIPLNNIVGFADLLTTGAQKEDEAFFISTIQQSTTKLLDMINDSLYLSRIDANMVVPVLRPVDFAELFENQCQSIWQQYQHEGVRLVVQNRYKNMTAMVDTDMVHRVLENFISNAARHTVAGTVRTSFEYHGGQITVIVEDTGSGMPEEVVSRVFDRFYKEDENEGTGLGLCICKAIAELHGGKIGIESTPGQGTLTWISIPTEVTEISRKSIHQ